jgi:pentatricopeptide repeat protein
MRARGIERTGITYSSLLQACEKAGRWQLGLELFQEMHRDGIKPSAAVYNALIATCGQGARPAVRAPAVRAPAGRRRCGWARGGLQAVMLATSADAGWGCGCRHAWCPIAPSCDGAGRQGCRRGASFRPSSTVRACPCDASVSAG